jgi:hypothetical protein
MAIHQSVLPANDAMNTYQGQDSIIFSPDHATASTQQLEVHEESAQLHYAVQAVIASMDNQVDIVPAEAIHDLSLVISSPHAADLYIA